MVNVLGVALPDKHFLRYALRSVYGVGYHTADHILARLQLHSRIRVDELTETQLNSLTSLLSSPDSAVPPTITLKPLVINGAQVSGRSPGYAEFVKANTQKSLAKDPLATLKIEEDLKREVRGNIAHLRSIGTLRGRLHQAGLPVRGQRNKRNARTAKRLNRLERRGYATSAVRDSPTLSIVAELARSRNLPGLW